MNNYLNVNHRVFIRNPHQINNTREHMLLSFRQPNKGDPRPRVRDVCVSAFCAKFTRRVGRGPG
jgi:hypothetical protein